MLFPPPVLPRSSSVSTAPTPVNEEDIAAARSILRSVINSNRTSPRSTSSFIDESANLQPFLPIAQKNVCSVGTQTDSIMPPTSLEGLIRAAGFSLANFSTELKVLERRIHNQHDEVLKAIRELRTYDTK
jgi:hypothetical protein